MDPAHRSRPAVLRRVVIESPYAGDTERNLTYLRACMADCLARGEAPFASHGLYTQPGVLDDANPDERELGMLAGMEWARCAYYAVVYTDLGISDGMRWGVARHLQGGLTVEYRNLPGWFTGAVVESVDTETGLVQYRVERLGCPLGDHTKWHDSEAQARAAWVAVEGAS